MPLSGRKLQATPWGKSGRMPQVTPRRVKKIAYLMNATLEFSKDATTNVSNPIPIFGWALNYRSLAMSEPLVIRCRENGPLLIQGPIKIMDHQGNEFVAPVGKDTIALCRCGQSKSRPFCDGSHKACGFQAAELALSIES